jgi:hypothetical protein
MAIVTMTRAVELRISCGRYREPRQNILITDMRTPLNTTSLNWSVHLGLLESDNEKVVLTNASPNDIVGDLLEATDVVTSCRLSAYKRYYKLLAKEAGRRLRDMRDAHGGIVRDVTLRQMVQLVGRSAEPLSRLSAEDPSGGFIYIPGVPGDLMLAMWSRLVPEESLDMWLATEEGVQHVPLHEAAQLCTRPEILSTFGCLACPQRGDCVSHVLEDSFKTVYSETRLRKAALTNHEWAPPSYVIDSRHGKIFALDVDLSGAEEKVAQSKYLSSKRVLNRKFYDKNCKTCALEGVCGLRKTGSNRGAALGRGVTDYCAGKVSHPLSLGAANYRDAFKILLQAIDIIRSTDHADTALEKIVEWVENGKPAPSYVRHAVSKQGMIAIPRELIDVAESLELRGGFDPDPYWWGQGHRVGRWFMDCTDNIVGVTDEHSSAPCGWVYLDYSGYLRRVSDAVGHTVFSYIDAKVLHQIEETSRSKNNKYSGVESRIALAAQFFADFIAPSNRWFFGAFGNQSISVPRGGYEYVRYDYVNRRWERKKRPARKTALDDLLYVFRSLRSHNNYTDTDFELSERANQLKDILDANKA